MKEHIIKNYIIKKNKQDIYDIAYNNIDFTSSVLNISNFIKGEFSINNKSLLLTRTDTFDINMDKELSDILSSTFLNNSKNVKIKIKNIILKSTDTKKIIKTKTYFTNLKYKLFDSINSSLNIIKIENTSIIEEIDNFSCLFSSHTKVKVFLPYPFKDIIETLGINVCTNLTNELLQKLQK